MMRKPLRFLSLLVVLLLGALLMAPATHAQGPSDPALSDEVTFDQLRVPLRLMQGPFDSMKLRFALPLEWQLTGNAELQLRMDTTIDRSGADSATDSDNPVSTLQLSLNGVWLETILLSEGGDRVVTLPIPDEALDAVDEDGYYELRILLIDDTSAADAPHTNVILKPDSKLLFPHILVPPPSDLRLLPRPLYRDTFLPDSAAIVVPDQPTAQELQAALTVAAGFGRMTDNQLALSLLPISKVNEKIPSDTHLIFVGNAKAFPLLAEVELPAPLNANGFEVADSDINDGIIQMALSPWDESKVVLVVSGNSEIGVLKAALAVSTGDLVASSNAALSLVVEVHGVIPPTSIAVDQTFAGLGYGVSTLTEAGENGTLYDFYIPAGQSAGTDAYLDLVFNHSTLLDYSKSRLLIYLNEVPIGSLRLNDNSAQLGTMRVILPRSALRPGNNHVSIQSDLVPLVNRGEAQLSDVWLTVWPESLLHLPLTPSSVREARAFNLGAFPELLTLSPTLSNVAFVLAQNDTVGWNVAVQMAASLGDATDGDVVDLVALYGSEVPDVVRRSRDLLIVGRPSKLPIIDELKDALPAPFAPRSDLIAEQQTRLAYRVAPGTSLGYLELLSAPWDRERLILGVLGSNNEGVRWAGRALLTEPFRSQLTGSVAVISDQQVIVESGTVGQRSLVGGDASTTEPTLSPMMLTDQPQFRWILPLLAVSILLMLFIIGFVTISSLRRRMQRTALGEQGAGS